MPKRIQLRRTKAEKSPRCPVVWLSSSERCERDTGHDGPHMTGLAPGNNLVHAWANAEDASRPVSS